MKKLMCADFIKGLGIGMAVGAAVGMMAMPKKRSMSGTMNRALKAAEDVVDVIADVLGL